MYQLFIQSLMFFNVNHSIPIWKESEAQQVNISKSSLSLKEMLGEAYCPVAKQERQDSNNHEEAHDHLYKTASFHRCFGPGHV